MAKTYIIKVELEDETDIALVIETILENLGELNMKDDKKEIEEKREREGDAEGV